MQNYLYHSIWNTRSYIHIFRVSVAHLFTEPSPSQPTPIYTLIMPYLATKVAILHLPIIIAFESPR